MLVSDYMSVGELAELVGVTVRSIQYYDQQGILSPSAKGPQNQRLYTPADVERLYCILCLKYAGLSLAEIRPLLAEGLTPTAARTVFLDALSETEQAFSTLLSRYATLRYLAQAAGAEVPASGLADQVPLSGEVAEDPEVPAGQLDWRSLARAIEHYQGSDKYFWRLSCIYDDRDEPGCDEPSGPAERPGPTEKDRVVAAWHSLISDALANMTGEEPADSPRSQALAERYLRLQAEEALRPAGEGFMLLESSPASRYPGAASFDAMRRNVNDYLEGLASRYRELHPA